MPKIQKPAPVEELERVDPDDEDDDGYAIDGDPSALYRFKEGTLPDSKQEVWVPQGDKEAIAEYRGRGYSIEHYSANGPQLRCDPGLTDGEAIVVSGQVCMTVDKARNAKRLAREHRNNQEQRASMRVEHAQPIRIGS